MRRHSAAACSASGKIKNYDVSEGLTLLLQLLGEVVQRLQAKAQEHVSDCQLLWRVTV